MDTLTEDVEAARGSSQKEWEMELSKQRRKVRSLIRWQRIGMFGAIIAPIVISMAGDLRTGMMVTTGGFTVVQALQLLTANSVARSVDTKIRSEKASEVLT